MSDRIEGVVLYDSVMAKSKKGEDQVRFKIATSDGNTKYVSATKKTVIDLHYQGRLKPNTQVVMIGKMYDGYCDGAIVKGSNVFAVDVRIVENNETKQSIPSPDYSNPWVGFYEEQLLVLLEVERKIGIDDRIAIFNKVKAMYKQN